MSRPALVWARALPPPEAWSAGLAQLARRAHALPQFAEAWGIDLRVVEVPDPLHPPLPELRAACRGAKAVWWSGRSLRRAEADTLWGALLEAADGVPCHDAPDRVWRTDDLSRFYPALRRAGLPQARTRCLPLRAWEVALEGPDLLRRLRRRLRWVFPRRGGWFVRSYFGTAKAGPGASVARRKADLPRVAATLVESLRAHQDLGGLALREVLPIAGGWDDAERYWLAREFRVFVVRGRPVYWVCHTNLDALRGLLSADDLTRLGAPSPDLRQRLHDWAQRAAATLPADLCTVDVAELADGAATVVEVNPGYCATWAHPAGVPWVFGRWLRLLAKLPDDPGALEEVLDDDWGRDVVWGGW